MLWFCSTDLHMFCASSVCWETAFTTWALRVYLENDSIPMGFGVFYPMRYIDRGEVFQTFYGSGQESVWLDGNFDGELVLQHGLAHVLRQLRLLGDGVYHLGGKIFVLRHVVFQL